MRYWKREKGFVVCGRWRHGGTCGTMCSEHVGMGQLLPCPQQGLVPPQGFAQSIVQVENQLGTSLSGARLGVATTAMKLSD